MKLSLDEVWVNMNVDVMDGNVRQFELAEEIYTNETEAQNNCRFGERTVTLQKAFAAIAENIHTDS